MLAGGKDSQQAQDAIKELERKVNAQGCVPDNVVPYIAGDAADLMREIGVDPPATATPGLIARLSAWWRALWA